MLRGIWQKVKDTVYNAITSTFRTQEEIDEIIETDLSAVATVYTSPDQVPADFKMRAREFWNVNDVERYLGDAGLSPEYVAVVPFPDWDDEGNTMYRVYIQEKQ